MEQNYDVYVTTKVNPGIFSPTDITYRNVPAAKISEVVKTHSRVTNVIVNPTPNVYGVYKLSASWATKTFDELENALAFAALESAKGTESEVRIEDS